MSTPRVLVAWIGFTDFRSAQKNDPDDIGPLARALQEPFERVHLLTTRSEAETTEFIDWLSGFTHAEILLHPVALTHPMHFGDIHNSAVDVVSEVTAQEVDLNYHLSPGTSAMAAVWIILSQTRFPGRLIQTSREAGFQEVDFPFAITADYLPTLLARRDARLSALNAGDRENPDPAFEEIHHRSEVMQRLIQRSRLIAPRSLPVLILGETGTGKELLARAIHRASLRRAQRMIALNCGAIPSELIESELFGHEKGAFTGAVRQKRGIFEQASGSSLFLDELGELPLRAQVKLLRVLQTGTLTRVGGEREVAVDVRIIAATHRDLRSDIVAGRFREDLFHRLAVAILRVPPLRQRGEDRDFLIDCMMERVNAESREETGFVDRYLSDEARQVLLAHPWPGNVRELLNTLRRAAVWSAKPKITAEDVQDALLPVGSAGGILDRGLGDGFSIRMLLDEVKQHYLERALEAAGGQKKKAAELLGLSNYQTVGHWLEKLG